MLSEQSVEKYRAIYQKQFGIKLTKEEATKQASQLLNLARVVCQPMPKAWKGRYEELSNEDRGDLGPISPKSVGSSHNVEEGRSRSARRDDDKENPPEITADRPTRPIY